MGGAYFGSASGLSHTHYVLSLPEWFINSLEAGLFSESSLIIGCLALTQQVARICSGEIKNLLKLCLFLLCFETGTYCLQVGSLSAVGRKVNQLLFHSALSVVGHVGDWIISVSQNIDAAKLSRNLATCFLWKGSVWHLPTLSSLYICSFHCTVYTVSILHNEECVHEKQI